MSSDKLPPGSTASSPLLGKRRHVHLIFHFEFNILKFWWLHIPKIKDNSYASSKTLLSKNASFFSFLIYLELVLKLIIRILIIYRAWETVRTSKVQQTYRSTTTYVSDKAKEGVKKATDAALNAGENMKDAMDGAWKAAKETGQNISEAVAGDATTATGFKKTRWRWNWRMLGSLSTLRSIEAWRSWFSKPAAKISHREIIC